MARAIGSIDRVHAAYTIGGRPFNFGSRTYIMGILNVTPDSFSDGGLYESTDAAVAHGLRMAEDGADIIDIGGESTRPRGKTYGEGAAQVPAEVEVGRIIPVIEALAARTRVPLSVDTWKAPVAKAALDAGASIVNDISGFHFDPEMPGVVAAAKATAVLMHTPAPPWEMPSGITYKDLVCDIREYLAEGLKKGKSAGVEQMIVDPGFGFGKSYAENLQLLRSLAEFLDLGYPVLAGMSRKSFLGKTLDLPVEERLEGSLAALVIAVMHGAGIVRVHDVRASRRAAAVADTILYG